MPRKRRAMDDPEDEEEEEEEQQPQLEDNYGEVVMNGNGADDDRNESEDEDEDMDQQEDADDDEEEGEGQPQSEDNVGEVVMNGNGADDDRNESEDENEDMDQQEDDDDEQENGDDEEAEETAGSPSPARRRDMVMRSGKRKRARSKDTTGLTPPERQSKTASSSARATKRSRTTSAATTTKTSAKSSRRQAVDAKPTPATDANGGTSAAAASPATVPDPRRISYAGGSRRAAVASSVAPVAEEPQEEEENSDEDIRHPPLPPTGVSVANGSATATSVTKTTVTVTQTSEIVTASAITQQEEVTEPTADENIEPTEEPDQLVLDIPDDGGYTTMVRLGFMFGLSLLFFVVWPIMVMVSNVLVPLNESMILPPPDMNIAAKQLENKEQLAIQMKEWNEHFVQDFDSLRNLDSENMESNEHLRNGYNNVQQEFAGLWNKQQDREQSIQKQLQDLAELENLLSSDHVNDADIERLQSTFSRFTNRPLLAATAVQLWSVPDSIDDECFSSGVSGTSEQDAPSDTKSFVTPQMLKEKESDLLLRAQMSAEKFMSGRNVVEKINSWVAPLIEKAIGKDTDVASTIARIPDILRSSEVTAGNAGSLEMAGVSSQSLLEIDQTIEVRLEVEQADTTGMIDRASLRNGAKLLFGGKRGTSKSLIDYLPLYNRLMQTANLRFYGYGPEIALTATYPPGALGQCWSFQPSTLKEQLHERSLYRKDSRVPDDFKRGSLGTLTVQFPSPVFVSNIVIEHVPQHQTDRIGSAIRSFRVVGYEDDAAATKAWNLGAFEYNKLKNANDEYLQEFEVASTSFGNDIPALQSISLAVDSNWGNDYTCLYRFRVHGEEEIDD